MPDIRQFKGMLYLVLFLGITGFALSGEVPVLWFLAMIGLGLNAWLVRTGRFRPLPRWLANSLTLMALVYVMAQIALVGSPPLMFIGQFLVLLQLIKLYEQRANRDYAQMLVLSLLLMVAASINTASLLFAVLLIVYLVVALYCCLLFHLKLETDRAKAACPISPEKINPLTLRQDQRLLPRSMRRFTGFVGAVSIALAVLVFLFFPRGAGSGVLGQLQLKPPTSLTGFSGKMDFQTVARIKQNNAEIARVFLWEDDRPIKDGRPFLFRGIALDAYGDRDRNDNREWSRSGRNTELVYEVNREISASFSVRPRAGQPVLHQRVSIQPNGSSVLFALEGVYAFRPDREMRIRYSPADESMQSTDMQQGMLDYETWSSGRLARPNIADRIVRQQFPQVQSNPRVLAALEQYTRRPEIIPAASVHRSKLIPLQEDNLAVAQAIEKHLQGPDFSYTLDLTDARELRGGDDPIVAFVTKMKRGHCEYFAAGMALMCQSVGIPARTVLGFKLDENDFNKVGGYYIVRESSAHAWCEVLTRDGWVSFDPTSSRIDHRTAGWGWWRGVKHFFDYLDFKWGENVIAYDRTRRENLITGMDRKSVRYLTETVNWMRDLKRWIADLPNNPRFWNFSSLFVGGIITLMVVGLFVFLIFFVTQKYRLRRRAERIGLDNLPPSRQAHLARQLVFYDRLMSLLDQHALPRPRHLTPREYAQGLSFLPPEAYDTIRRLTRLFYRVRFGQAELDAAAQRRLNRAIDALAASLGPPAGG